MHRVHAASLALAVALASTLTLAAGAAAGTSAAKVSVCRLLGKKQVSAIRGVSTRCTSQAALPGPGSTTYVGTWAGTTAQSPHLQVTVSVYTDGGALQLAKRNLDQGLTGAPKKANGIGSGAYTASSPMATEVKFAVGKDVVVVIASPIAKSSRSSRSVEVVAQALAKKLAGKHGTT
jgi:hypothetical protein